ncbi:MAG: hypothetical protein GY707_05390 [Desulfobacteraceae bacterium]|nr:hypothetical protein [Desulfobacteraceae bacterium]
MKYLILVILLVTMSAYAEDKYSDKYKTAIAKERAVQHPKGSGIGTNRYNVKYDKSYSVDKYVRSPCCDPYND